MPDFRELAGELNTGSPMLTRVNPGPVQGSYADPSYRPPVDMPQITRDALKALAGYLINAVRTPIQKTMGPLYGEMGGTSEDVLMASMMGLPGRVKVGREDILAGIKRLQRPGQSREMISLMKLYDELGMPKAEFDSQIMKLVKEGKLDIHKHDYPAGMKPHEKETALVLDDPLSYREDKKAYYNAVSIRPDEI